MKIAIFGSTNGTDMQAIIDAMEKKDARMRNMTIEFVFTNEQKAGIVNRAKKHNLKVYYVPSNGLGKKARRVYDEKITKLLEEHSIDLILLIGYMKLMSPEFVQRWENKVANIHPSLLPCFAGLMDKNVHAEVLERGCKLTGATLMFIDEGADTGPIIAQKAVEVKQTDTVDDLKARVQAAEQDLLLDFLPKYRDGKITVKNKKVYFA